MDGFICQFNNIGSTKQCDNSFKSICQNLGENCYVLTGFTIKISALSSILNFFVNYGNNFFITGLDIFNTDKEYSNLVIILRTSRKCSYISFIVPFFKHMIISVRLLCFIHTLWPMGSRSGKIRVEPVQIRFLLGKRRLYKC